MREAVSTSAQSFQSHQRAPELQCLCSGVARELKREHSFLTHLRRIDDSSVHHVDVLAVQGVVADLGAALQDFFHHQGTLHSRVLGDGHGRDAQRSADDVDT